MAKGTGQLKVQLGSLAVNAPASTVVVDFSRFTAPRGALAKIAPIDEYYAGVKELLRSAAEPSATDQNRRLLVVEVVAYVERYVRSVLVALVATCPCSQRVVARKQVSIASVSYYDADELAFAVLDHQALSGQSEIARATIQILGIDVKQNGSAFVALAGFERVCQLRHAIVHQAGRLGPNNLLELDVQGPSPLVVTIDLLGFQDVVAICHAAVRAYNQYIFESILGRWVMEGAVVGDWHQDKALFEKLCALLISRVDNAALVVADEYKKIWEA